MVDFFWRLKDIDKGTKHGFIGCKTLTNVKVKCMYVEVKLQEARFN